MPLSKALNCKSSRILDFFFSFLFKKASPLEVTQTALILKQFILDTITADLTSYLL